MNEQQEMIHGNSPEKLKNKITMTHYSHDFFSFSSEREMVIMFYSE